MADTRLSLSKIPIKENLFVGSIFTLRGRAALEQNKITHILSVIEYSLENVQTRAQYKHLSIDIDDIDDSDLLVILPRCVRFITMAVDPNCPELNRRSPPNGSISADAITSASPDQKDLSSARLDPQTVNSSSEPGAVLVHCAMGKSRSVSVTIAWLLWRYPEKFSDASQLADRSDPAAARDTVSRALKMVRDARPNAEPNPGFMQQLAIWWHMGCPAGSDDAVERHPIYKRWAYKREVEESARVGRAPDYLRFEDEEEGSAGAGGIVSGGEARGGAATLSKETELRCKICRKVLATGRWVVPHDSETVSDKNAPCQHYFVEPLSWMRSTLEEGTLEGRLVCPNAKCSSSVGRFSWQGFKCSCRQWVCPAFSLQRSRVDEVAPRPAGSAADSDHRAKLGIRLPPGARRENL